jgi:uncharacterized protein YjbI with pentapeptide repeats
VKKIQIRSWYNDKVLFETDVEDDDLYPIRTAVDRARLDRASLDRASLDGASLDGASLDGARLDGASLVGARLVGARLDRASLDGARLDGASLDGARLVGARLDGARLVGARLDGARLDGASLVGARLDGARLVGARLDGARLDGARLDGVRLDGARLVGARLDGVRLDGASLVGASLVGASLDRASLDRASLDNIRADFRQVLDKAPDEILGLLSAIRGGRVDGSCYEGACACLLGTIANIRHCRHDQLKDLRPDSERLSEKWFLALRPGITPQNNPVAKITERWILEWMEEKDMSDPRVGLRKLARDAAAGFLFTGGGDTSLGVERALVQLANAVVDLLPEDK